MTAGNRHSGESVSINRYLCFLVASLVAVAVAIFAYQYWSENRQDRFQHVLIEYHLSTLLAIEQIKDELLELDIRLHRSEKQGGVSAVPLDLANGPRVIRHNFDDIAQRQQSFAQPAFAEALERARSRERELLALLNDVEGAGVTGADALRTQIHHLLEPLSQLARLHLLAYQSHSDAGLAGQQKREARLLIFIGLAAVASFSLVALLLRKIQSALHRQQQTRDLLTISERRLAGIIELAMVAVISVDADGRIRLFNKEAERIFGYRTEDVLGQSINVLLPERYRQNHEQQIKQFLKSSENFRRMSQRGTLCALHKDGTEFPVEASISKLVLPDEIALTVILRDVTERRLAESALLAAKEDAERANQAKSQFLANMSHELRTPLNAVNGFSELLAEEALGPLGSEEYRKFAHAINESGHHLLSLINDVLDISKIEAGAAEIVEETFELLPVIETCVAMCTQQAAAGGVELSLDNADVASLYLHADKRRIKQVLLNLLSNAVKFTEAGGRVTIRAWNNQQSGVVIQVIDTGIGISPDNIPKALAPFQQVEEGYTRKHQGTGLGLPLAKSLIEQHGGSLDLQSEVGVGTTVTVRLPPARAKLKAA